MASLRPDRQSSCCQYFTVNVPVQSVSPVLGLGVTQDTREGQRCIRVGHPSAPCASLCNEAQGLEFSFREPPSLELDACDLPDCREVCGVGLRLDMAEGCAFGWGHFHPAQDGVIRCFVVWGGDRMAHVCRGAVSEFS